METPIEIYVRALVDGVQFAPIAHEEAETAVPTTVDGSPLPLYVREAIRRDRFPLAWTLAHLGVSTRPEDAPLMLLLLGSGTFRRFIEKNPRVLRVDWTGEPVGSAKGKRG